MPDSSPSYLLDTNIASYVLKRKFPLLAERLARTQPAEIGISVVTEAELRFGVSKQPEAKWLNLAVNEFLLRIKILPWDSEAAKNYAEIRSALERQGQPLWNLDLMIAAHALALGCTLVTHDRAFQRVKGLKLVDWTR